MKDLNLLIIFITLLVSFFIIDVVASNKQGFKGVVIDKHYKSSRTSVGSGVATGANGSSTVVTTVQTEPEEFYLIVRTTNCDIVTVKCSSELYYSKEISQDITCEYYIGLFTGAIIGQLGIK